MSALRAGIVGERESWHNQALSDAWNLHGVQPVFIDGLNLQANLGGRACILSREIELNRLDILMLRHIPGGSLEQVIYRMDALHQLEDQGVRLVNRPGALEKMVDKYYTSALLQTAGLRVPDTVVCENASRAASAFSQLGGDVIIKPLFGSRGSGIVRVSQAEIAWRVLYALQMNGFVAYMQKFIPHGNSDLRVLVLNGECIAAMRRISPHWKNNLSQGARPAPYELETDVRSASIEAARAVGADYCGVDLLRGDDGRLYVLEVNSTPAWQGLQQVTSFDIAGRIVEGCLSLLEGAS